MKVCLVLGTRPEIIKMAPVIRECLHRHLDHFVIHSNQHYSVNMNAVFFQDLNLPLPQYNLHVGSSSHAEMTAKILTGIEPILLRERPDWILVQGDTNTTMAAALAAAKIGIKVGHIEAGLRSYDPTMPEEINRIITDHISHALFAPTPLQSKILKQEGIDPQNTIITGNTVVDAIEQHLSFSPKNSSYLPNSYFLLTLHRPANVDSSSNFAEILQGISEVSRLYHLPVIFPIHPRTQKQLELFGLSVDSHLIKIVEPVGYLDMLALEKNASIIFTDSGGIQEEACILHVPSITLRDNTERPEAIKVRASILTGHHKHKIIAAATKMINSPRNWTNPFGDGTAAKKIIDFLK